MKTGHQCLVLSVLLYLFCGHLALAQGLPVTLPRLILTDFKLLTPTSPEVPFTYNVTFDLDLTEDQKKDLTRFIADVSEFIDEFNRKKDELENEYRSSSGENKIANALGLLRFVVIKNGEWQRFSVPYFNTWKGHYTMSIVNPELITVQADGEARIEFCEKTPTGTAVTKLTGGIDGTLKISSNVNYFSELVSLAIGGSYSFSDILVGRSALSSEFMVTQKFGTADGQFRLSLETLGIGGMEVQGETHGGKSTFAGGYLFPFGYGFFSGNDNSYHGYTVTYNFYTHMLERVEINKAVTPIKEYQLFKFCYVQPETEDIDWKKYYDLYFRAYVTSINEERFKQFNRNSQDDQTREDIANKTVHTLLSAETYGQQIGIEQSTIAELQLLLKVNNSLYDRWFARWFTSADTKWQKKVGSAQDETNRVYCLEERMVSMLRFFQHGDMIASAGMMEDLLLIKGSSFVCERISEYFTHAHPVKCRDLGEGSLSTDDFNQWKMQLYGIAVQFANDGLASDILSSQCSYYQ